MGKVDLIQVWQKACADGNLIKGIGHDKFTCHINVAKDFNFKMGCTYGDLPVKWYITFGKLKQEITRQQFDELSELHNAAMNSNAAEIALLKNHNLI